MNELERVGLSKNEIKVYKALLDLGSSQAGKIAEKAGIHRRASYDALNRLIEKGLVSFAIKNGVKYFEAANPEKLKDILSEKEQEIKREQAAVTGILPDLMSKYKATKSRLESNIYKGKEGIKTVMELILKENKDWLSIGSTGKGPKILTYFLPGWHKRRLKQKIQLKSLVANTEEGKNRGKEFIKMGLAQVRVLPKEIQQPQTIFIFGNKVAIVLVSMDQPVAFLIDNKEISNAYREYFNLFWKQSRAL